MLDLIELVKPEAQRIKYVFFDTGLEWDATHAQIVRVQKRYKIDIEPRKAREPIPIVCKRFGVPFLDKTISAKLRILQNQGFDFNEAGHGLEHLKIYEWWTERKTGQFALKPDVKAFLINNPPSFGISDQCCDYAKKYPAQDFYKEYKPDLDIQGVRKKEGGPRASAYKNCFTKDEAFDRYRPLFFWTDKDKQLYKKWRKIRYSDCYEKWGFQRTGCVGCPCSIKAVKDLESAKAYEPNKVKAAYAIFGASYEYRAQYERFRARFKR